MNASWQVPAFSALSYFPRRHPYCVCIPVLNEGLRIQRQLLKMREWARQVDFLLADGGSRDGSLDEVLLKDVGVRALLTKTGPGKLSAQMRMAIAYSLEQGYEGLVFMDGNDKDDPAAIPLFLEALAAGYDHVQGSRFIPGGKAINTPLSRLLGLKLLHAPLISFAAGFRYTDTTNGFRAYSRRFLMDPRVQPLREVFSHYELHYYLAIRAARLGFLVKEVPVTRAYPPKGSLPTKISPIKGNFSLLKTLILACLQAYDPKEGE